MVTEPISTLTSFDRIPPYHILSEKLRILLLRTPVKQQGDRSVILLVCGSTTEWCAWRTEILNRSKSVLIVVLELTLR
jgi:hypothetical protein